MIITLFTSSSVRGRECFSLASCPVYWVSYAVMIVSAIFFALLGVFIYAAVRAAKESSVSPGSRPGNVVEADDGSGERLNPQANICTCQDWQRYRAHFAVKGPMRLCRHLTAWHARHINLLPDHLRSRAAMIALLASEGQGMPCDAGTEYGHLDEVAYVLYVVRGRDGAVRARLILGGRRYDLQLDQAANARSAREARDAWSPEPPPRQSYYLPRAVQLANAAFNKK